MNKYMKAKQVTFDQKARTLRWHCELSQSNKRTTVQDGKDFMTVFIQANSEASLLTTLSSVMAMLMSLIISCGISVIKFHYLLCTPKRAFFSRGTSLIRLDIMNHQRWRQCRQSIP